MNVIDPYQIKADLNMAGYSQTDIARSLGVTPTSVHCVIFRGAVSAKIRAAIARAIGKEVSDLWPEASQEISQTATGSKQ